MDAAAITIELATGPRQSDRRTRYGYVPDRKAEQEEINRMFAKGLLFIGDWHTHPERLPQPSHSDLRSIRNVFRASKHHLPAFLLLIAGTDPFPDGLCLSLYSADSETTLTRLRMQERRK